jgi:hypothetical protein
VGRTLTADTTGLTEQSGTLSYAWKANDVSVGTDASTYTVGSNDLGKTITVTVTSTGNTGSITSNPTAAVAEAPQWVAYTGLAAHLATLSANTAAAPYTVALAPVDISGVWSDINTAVSGKYVILDLSDCSATGNTISGNLSSPTGNDMNIIKNNQYIKGIILPDTLTTIGNNAFRDCTGLTSVTIPSSVNTIGDYAFSDCTSLTSITVDSGNANYADEGGVLFNKAKTTLVCYPAGKTGSYSIPSSVNTIGDGAFRGCTNLTSVTIPSNVNTIGNGAFNDTGLTSVTIPTSVNTIGDWAFYNYNGLTSVTFDTGSSISESNFSSVYSFPGDLRDKYLAGGGGAGTYTRPSGSDTWTKQ